MKKIACFLLLALCVCLSACAPKPNMDTILSYQSAGTEMTLCITDTETFRGILKITENGISFTFTDGKREGISYRVDNSGGFWMFYEDVEIPIDPTDELKCKEWLALFSIPSGDNIWKIKRETLGGIELFVCRDDRITLYIDAVSMLPLKIESGNIKIDVLSCKTK